MKTITAYHYTSQSLWMLGDVERRGLVPCSPLVKAVDMKDLPEIARKPYLFALLEAKPESWRKNKEFPRVWDRFIKSVSHGDFVLMRCAFDLVPEDSAFVVDWAHIEKIRNEARKLNKSYMSAAEYLRIIDSANHKYLDSMVRAQNYRGEYDLPELAIANSIPGERLKEFGVCDPETLEFID